MIEKVQALALILDRMNVLYGRALDLLERERDMLIRLDYEGLFGVLREKDEVLAALRGLDRDRLRHQDWFAVVMNRDPEQLSLRDIGEALVEQGDAKNGLRLLDLRSRMHATMTLVEERVIKNCRLIEGSVANLQGIAANLAAAITGKSGPGGKKAGVYNNKKHFQQDDGGGRGTIVERRL